MRLKQTPTQNRLLAELELTEFHRLSPYLELVNMERGHVVYQMGAKMTYVYFPTTATISTDYVLEDGATSEIVSIGSEGLLGVPLFMGDINAPARAIVQVAGYAYRLSAAKLMDEFYHKGPLLRLLLRYAQTQLTQISQLAVCNSHHTTEQRLCRWLLQTLDRSRTRELAITQEALAAALGVRREAVTEAAGRLQQEGIIKWRRGHVEVLLREGLESHVCECHAVVRHATAGLLPKLALAPAGVTHPWRQRDESASRRLAAGDRRHHDQPGDPQAADETQAELDFF
jgi:CRP-like cAMP-binding protein